MLGIDTHKQGSLLNKAEIQSKSKDSKLNLIEIFTDGACRGNPGLGGWAALIRYRKQEKTWYGIEAHTTNNRMELTAALMSVKVLDEFLTQQGILNRLDETLPTTPLIKEPKAYQVILNTDSEYVKKGMTEWLSNWEKRGWLTVSKKPVKNSDLWKQLAQEANHHPIEWRWLRGHNGHRENELVDRLANQAIDEWIVAQKA